MKLAELRDKSVLILGLGVEGLSTLRFLRAAFPEKTLGLADQVPLGKLPAATAEAIRRDPRIRLHLGPEYLASLDQYDVIVKAPGIPVTLPAFREALAAGKKITSQTALFFANYQGTIVGVTGTKGKSTTASLLHAMLKKFLPDALLAGNIGVPMLDVLGKNTKGIGSGRMAVCELSSHQLEGLRQSPHIAVLLSIVPEHLDYYDSFDSYVDAKENITRFQSERDFLVYDADHDLANRIASRSKARRIACSLSNSFDGLHRPGCFLAGDAIVYRAASGEEQKVVDVRDVTLPGRFNLINVAAAAAAAMIAGVPALLIAEAIREFRPLEHRLECVGTFDGVTYYNDSIATVPEATIAALDTLGAGVETVLLGGADRGLDFSNLASRLKQSAVKTVILFPPSGERIWKAIRDAAGKSTSLPQHHFVDSMEEAVALAKRHTAKGMICLHSPASPSFGLFRDYRERGEAFKRLVKEGHGGTEAQR